LMTRSVHGIELLAAARDGNPARRITEH
jgi:hypothetical protein